MSNAIPALRADRDALLELCKGLSDADWKAPSGCPGWSTQDLISHLAVTFWMVVDPSKIGDASGLPTEQAQEVLVDARRSVSTSDLIDEYATVSEKAIEALEGLAGADFEMPLGDIGTYHASVLPTAFCFDHFTHIRADLFAPRGSLTGSPPPSDELRVAPTLVWIEAALPQQNPGAVTKPAELAITGPAERTIHVGPEGDPVAAVSSDADAFVRWITQRGSWEDLGVQASGDSAALAELRPLKVF